MKTNGSQPSTDNTSLDESVSEVITEYVPISRQEKHRGAAKSEESKARKEKQENIQPEHSASVGEALHILDEVEEPEDLFVTPTHPIEPSAPAPQQPKTQYQNASKGSKGLLFLLVLLMLTTTLGYGFYLLYTRAKRAEREALSPQTLVAPQAPTGENNQLIATPEPAASIAPTPAPKVNKKDFKIRVENGTTVAGEAGRWKTFLEEQGYVVESIGNAARQDQTQTTVQAKESAQAIVPLLIADLKEKAEASASSTALSPSRAYDVLVTIGQK